MSTTARADPAHQEIFGQPRGLATLFLTEMWERFSYYGMRSILILYAVAAVSDGGFGLDDRNASSIYGLYIAATYVFALFGGWMADRLLGAQRAVIIGGLFILCGNALLVLGHAQTFFLGLVIIVLGVGLLKPNISVMVAELYPEGGARRDAGFSIFYVGISVGALLGSLLVPLCAARYGWRWGFGLPVVGMVLGLAQFMLTRKWLGQRGRRVERRESRRAWLPVVVFVLVVATVVTLALTGVLAIDPVKLGAAASWVIALFAFGFFAYLVLFAGLDAQERGRVYVMGALFAAYAIFFAGFEQGGASLNLFAERYTDLNVFGWRMPAGVLQGDDRALHHPVRAGLRRLVDRTRPARQGLRAFDQVRGRAYAARGRVSRDVCRRRLRRIRRKGFADVASLHVLPAGMRGPVPLAGRSVLDDQACAAALRGPGDGSVVPGTRARQQPRRPALGRIRRA